MSSFKVPPHDTFQTVDLYENKNMRAVLINLHSLGRQVQRLPEYNGPTLGARLATQTVREFSEAQLAEARAAGTFLGGSMTAAATLAVSEAQAHRQGAEDARLAWQSAVKKSARAALEAKGAMLAEAAARREAVSRAVIQAAVAAKAAAEAEAAEVAAKRAAAEREATAKKALEQEALAAAEAKAIVEREALKAAQAAEAARAREEEAALAARAAVEAAEAKAKEEKMAAAEREAAVAALEASTKMAARVAEDAIVQALALTANAAAAEAEETTNLEQAEIQVAADLLALEEAAGAVKVSELEESSPPGHEGEDIQTELEPPAALDDLPLPRSLQAASFSSMSRRDEVRESLSQAKALSHLAETNEEDATAARVDAAELMAAVSAEKAAAEKVAADLAAEAAAAEAAVKRAAAAEAAAAEAAAAEAAAAEAAAARMPRQRVDPFTGTVFTD